MFKVGTECPGIYQSPSRNWTLDAGCVSRLAMLTVLRAAGGWALVISPPDPRHPQPSRGWSAWPGVAKLAYLKSAPRGSIFGEPGLRGEARESRKSSAETMNPTSSGF